MDTGNIFIVTAPSGTGKTTLVAALLSAESAVQLSVSHTTRQPRDGEVHGRHYHFVTTAEFELGIENGEFLEHAQVYGNYYGTSSLWIRKMISEGKDILLEIDWQGAQQVKKEFPQAISVFIAPPSLEELEKRLRGRGTDSDEVIARRLSMATDELLHGQEFDYLIVNDDLGKATIDMVSIIKAERLRMSHQGNFLRQLMA